MYFVNTHDFAKFFDDVRFKVRPLVTVQTFKNPIADNEITPQTIGCLNFLVWCWDGNGLLNKLVCRLVCIQALLVL